MRSCLLVCGFMAPLLSMGLFHSSRYMSIEFNDVEPAFVQMGALPEKERMELIKEQTQGYYALQNNLIHQLGAATSKHHRFSAAFLLGLYRMPDAASHMAKYIALEETERRRNKRLPLWGRYPVAEALIRIGRPAVPAMLQNIATSDDEKVCELSANVIRHVEDPEIGRFIVERAIKKQPDAEKKKRLQEALKYFEDKPK